jgi:hypothetical protein
MSAGVLKGEKPADLKRWFASGGNERATSLTIPNCLLLNMIGLAVLIAMLFAQSIE